MGAGSESHSAAWQRCAFVCPRGRSETGPPEPRPAHTCRMGVSRPLRPLGNCRVGLERDGKNWAGPGQTLTVGAHPPLVHPLGGLLRTSDGGFAQVAPSPPSDPRCCWHLAQELCTGRGVRSRWLLTGGFQKHLLETAHLSVVLWGGAHGATCPLGGLQELVL